MRNNRVDTKSRWRLLAVLAAAAFATTLISRAPATVAPALIGAERNGISYQKIDGLMWRGEISKLSVGGAALGDVRYALKGVSLTRFALWSQLFFMGTVDGEGDFAVGRGFWAAQGADLDIDLGPFIRTGVFGAPVDGRAQVNVKKVAFSKRGCEAAEGTVWTDILLSPARRYGLSGFPMSGSIACAGANLEIALEGGGEEGNAALRLTITPAMTYELSASAAAKDDNIAEALKLFGFEDKAGELTYGSTGLIMGAQ